MSSWQINIDRYSLWFTCSPVRGWDTKPCGTLSSLCCINSQHTSLFFSFQCLCLLKETHGTKHKIYSLCMLLIIGSKVKQVFELFVQTLKQPVWIQSLHLHALSVGICWCTAAWLSVLIQIGCRARFLTISWSQEHLVFVKMCGIWVTGHVHWGDASFLLR